MRDYYISHVADQYLSLPATAYLPVKRLVSNCIYPSTMERSPQYVFRNPFASSILPILSPDDIIPILYQINESKSPEKRLPTEILLRINKEMQRNTIWEEIRTTWSLIPETYEMQYNPGFFGYGMSPLQARLDVGTKTYSKVELEPNPFGIPMMMNRFDGTSTEEMYCQISSADLLYRLRCYFPEMIIDSNLDRYKCVWETLIRHNQTGLLLSFYDYKGAASVKVHYDKESEYQITIDSKNSNAQKELEEAFCVDGIRFLNALFETVDGSRRMSFYHPAADADTPTDNEHYTAVPYNYGHKRCHKTVAVYNKWRSITKFSLSDISSFRSILQDLKYDIPSRKIDPSNGITNLTAVISSPLLFYRLICKFMLGHIHVNVNQVPPITSVWQIQLVHKKTGAFIIFMDNYGLFDIRVDGKAEGVMGDIQALVELLCSDACTHPYDDVLAGCVA